MAAVTNDVDVYIESYVSGQFTQSDNHNQTQTQAAALIAAAFSAGLVTRIDVKVN
jgi:hypothetical protein